MAIKKLRYPIPSGGAADAFVTWSVALGSGEIHQSLDYFTASLAGNIQSFSERDVFRPASPTHNVPNTVSGVARSLHLGTAKGTTAVVVMTMLNNGTQVADGRIEVVIGGNGNFISEFEETVSIQQGESATYHLMFVVN